MINIIFMLSRIIDIEHFGKTEIDDGIAFNGINRFFDFRDSIGQAGMTSILIELIGVLLLSETPEICGDWFKKINNYPSKLGVLSGFLFGISAICYRCASLEIDSADP